MTADFNPKSTTVAPCGIQCTMSVASQSSVIISPLKTSPVTKEVGCKYSSIAAFVGYNPLVRGSNATWSTGVNFTITKGIVGDSQVRSPVIGEIREVNQSLRKQRLVSITHFNPFTLASSSNSANVTGEHLQHRNNLAATAGMYCCSSAHPANCPCLACLCF